MNIHRKQIQSVNQTKQIHAAPEVPIGDTVATCDRSCLVLSIHYHIRALRHIRSSISEDMAKMVACALVGSRLDYANSVLFGATQKNISKLQKAQNLLARVHYLFSSMLQSTYSYPAAPLAPD